MSVSSLITNAHLCCSAKFEYNPGKMMQQATQGSVLNNIITVSDCATQCNNLQVRPRGEEGTTLTNGAFTGFRNGYGNTTPETRNSYISSHLNFKLYVIKRLTRKNTLFSIVQIKVIFNVFFLLILYFISEIFFLMFDHCLSSCD